MPKRRPVASPGKLTTPSVEEPDIPATASEESDVPATASEGSDILATQSGEPATALTRGPTVPPTLPETDKQVEVALAHELPSGMEIHPLHPVTLVGQVPSNLVDLRQHHQSCISSRSRAQHHQMEEQRSGGQGDSSSASSCESLMPDPTLEDPSKAPLPYFREIT